MKRKGVTSVLARFSLFPLESAPAYKYLQENHSRNMYGKDFFLLSSSNVSWFLPHQACMRLRTAGLYQFEQAAFPQSFYLWSGPEYTTSHRWLNTVRPEVFQGILPVIPAARCSLLVRAQMQQLTAKNCLVCVLNQPTNSPSASRRKNVQVRAVKLDPRG